MIDFLSQFTFWQWYWADVTWKSLVFAWLVFGEGKMTAKELGAYIMVTFIPVLNMVLTGLGLLAAIQAVAESDDDVVLWRRNSKVKEKNVD